MNSNDKFIKPWDKNAHKRHQQLKEGLDISFSKILVPAVISLIRDLEGHENFKTLDIGCGSGVFSQILSDNVNYVTAIDPSCESIQIARKFNENTKNISFICTSIEEFSPKPFGLFDLVIAHMTFHTIKNLDITFRKITEIIKEKGYLVFSIPHPCFYFQQKGNLKNYKFSYNTPDLYWIPFTISQDRTPLPAKTPYFHRKIEIYTSKLFKSGYVINKIIEPFPDQRMMSLYPSDRNWKSPHFIIFLCQK